MSTTKHLDTAISILKGTEGAKRAKRKAQVEILVETYGMVYTIQMNGKTIEEGTGSKEYAKERAEDRASRIRALGKTCLVVVS